MNRTELDLLMCEVVAAIHVSLNSYKMISWQHAVPWGNVFVTRYCGQGGTHAICCCFKVWADRGDEMSR